LELGWSEWNSSPKLCKHIYLLSWNCVVFLLKNVSVQKMCCSSRKIIFYIKQPINRKLDKSSAGAFLVTTFFYWNHSLSRDLNNEVDFFDNYMINSIWHSRLEIRIYLVMLNEWDFFFSKENTAKTGFISRLYNIFVNSIALPHNYVIVCLFGG